MKLVEILAREMEEWPEPNGHAWQDYNKEIRFNRTIESDFYVDQMCHDHIREYGKPNPSTGVTRADWEAERARIKGEKAMPKANKDGWIRHRGVKCPVEAGTLVDVRHRDGEIFTGVSALDSSGAEEPNWLHDTQHKARGEIMAWRPHKPDHEALIQEGIDSADAGKLTPIEDVRAKWERSSEAEMPATKEEGPIQWRDRIREIDATTIALNEERASLVAKLAAEGFALIQGDEPDVSVESAHGEKDMSDWRNWRAGDLVKSIDDEADDIRIGGVYRLWKDPNVYGGDLYLIDSDGDKRNRCIENYAFHSRPTP